MGSSPGGLERPLPQVPEALSRERLRWEKELLGLYLSEHPLGALSEQIAQYVTAYSGDLKDESLDGQRVVMGGIVTGVRTVTTRNKETMAVATLEDLQGTLEVVVFPRMYATSPAPPSPRARSCSWPGGSTIAARRRRCSPTRSGSGRMPPPAARRRLPRKWPPGSAAGRRA
jgi:hypothetical protein